jgi:hypothetical protein
VRIRGELAKLGIRVSATAIRTLLRRSGLGPAPRRSGPTWREFLSAQAEGSRRPTCFTVESIWLRTLYVCFVIELRTRRVRLAAATSNPDAAWVTQQARNLSFDLTHGGTFRFRIWCSASMRLTLDGLLDGERQQNSGTPGIQPDGKHQILGREQDRRRSGVRTDDHRRATDLAVGVNPSAAPGAPA